MSKNITTAREQFAMAALQGLLGNSRCIGSYEEIAEDAAKYADALLAELERTDKAK